MFLKHKGYLDCLIIHIKEKARFHRFLFHFPICKEYYTVDDTDGQSWLNYIGWLFIV